MIDTEWEKIMHKFSNNHEYVNVKDLKVGDVLAENILSKVNVPNYRASIVDGYAIIGNY